MKYSYIKELKAFLKVYMGRSPAPSPQLLSLTSDGAAVGPQSLTRISCKTSRGNVSGGPLCRSILPWVVGGGALSWCRAAACLLEP